MTSLNFTFFINTFKQKSSIYSTGMLKYCFYSVTNLCPTLWDPMDNSTLGFSVLHHLPEFGHQTHVYNRTEM